MSAYDRMLEEFDRLDDEHHGFDREDADELVCPECDGDGYVDIVDDWGGVVGPAPCPKCGGLT